MRRLRLPPRSALPIAALWLLGISGGCDDVRLPALVPDGGLGGHGGETTGSGGDDHKDLMCDPPASACKEGCYDLATSNEHCGACEVRCTGGASCAAGVCGCPVGQTRCDNFCVSTMSDAKNCGACDHECESDEVCVLGVCASGSCPGEQGCGEACTDLTTSNEHCGECGEVCSGGSSCVGSQCTCPQGQKLCKDKCVMLDNDPEHCGQCYKECSSGICTGGACK